MEYLAYIQAAIDHMADVIACLCLLGIGLVVCGFIDEFFSERKMNLRHEELVREKQRYSPRVEG